MPSTSDKQHNFMGMSMSTKGRALLKSHGKKPAPKDVAKEFLNADHQVRAAFEKRHKGNPDLGK